MIQLTDNEKKVLTVLADETDTWGERCIGFDWIIGDTNLTRKEVQKACKKLREYKFVHFYRGLMTEDGEVAGSGYCVSSEGEAFIYPCDKCSDARDFDWWEDEYGKQVFQRECPTAKHIQLCKKHYDELKAKRNKNK